MTEQEPTFAEAFRKVIAMVDPQANSLMSKDNPPSVKILADWGRKACDELEKSPWIKITPDTEFGDDPEYMWCSNKKDKEILLFGDLELHFEGGYDFTHYRPITLPEKG